VIDHVGIRVSDLDASQRFYNTVLPVLGLERYDGDPTCIEWGDFAIGDDGPVTKHLHVGFFAPTHALVDAFHRAGVEAGYEDDGAPGPRPQYREDYYGAFLRDPDGNSVEAVYTGQTRATGAIDHVFGVDEPDHVQIVTASASVSYVTGEPVTEHVHIAFAASTNDEVDAFHQAAIGAGYEDNGAPGERTVYHPGYYGAFVFDPDGHNIEAVNHNR